MRACHRGSACAQRRPRGAIVLIVSLIGNALVGFLLLLMSYTVAYFGVLMPDRVVRYRLLRFFMRGPVWRSW